MRKIIDKLIALEAWEWHKLTMQVAWFFRTSGAKECPAKVVAWMGGRTPSQAEWQLIRKTTNAARKQAKVDEKRILEKRAREARRRYMKTYMQERRAKLRNNSPS